MQQQRWCYYRVFFYQVRKSQAQFIGCHLGSECRPNSDGTVHFLNFCNLYEDQDGYLYLFFESDEVPGWPDYARIWCRSFLKAKSREELVGCFRRFATANGVENPVVPSLIAPLPEVETMHTLTGYDS
jgi:hypothetical protein